VAALLRRARALQAAERVPRSGRRQRVSWARSQAVDAAIGDLLAPLESDGTLERALVLVVADHGESLGEHGEATHGAFCYETTVRVPVPRAFPGRLRGGTRSAAPVSVADVCPTALDALGLAIPNGLDGVQLVALRSPT
jgi:arylsulfatase A-like enzyme